MESACADSTFYLPVICLSVLPFGESISLSLSLSYMHRNLLTSLKKSPLLAVRCFLKKGQVKNRYKPSPIAGCNPEQVGF